MMRSIRPLFALCLVLAAARVSADGPHWQMPSPWTEYEIENEGRGKGPKVGPLPPKAGRPGITKLSPFVSPSRFELMDEECIKYFEQHCSIKYPGNKSEFYLMLMDKAGQTFAEVQQYCPCPDSYPLWHSEEGRDFMRWAAGEVWIASTKLPAKDAIACAKYIVNYYVQVVRYSKDPDLAKNLADFMEYNKKCAELADKFGNETDEAKKAQLMGEWRQFAKGAGMGTTKGAIKTLDGIMHITGDIKFVHDMTVFSMTEALVKMGPGLLPILNEAMKTAKNPEVFKALTLVGQQINVNAANKAKQPPQPVKKAPMPPPKEPLIKKPDEAKKPDEVKEEKKPEVPEVKDE